MKKLLFISLFLIFSLTSCTHNVSYEIRNKTEYDVTLIDVKDVVYPEYFIKANTTINIDHTTNGCFEIKNNTYPIELKYGYIFTEIDYLKNYELQVYNNSNKQLSLEVLNTTHDSTRHFIIENNFSNVISIYCKVTPEVKLYYNNSEYNNFVIRDNNLIIN